MKNRIISFVVFLVVGVAISVFCIAFSSGDKITKGKIEFKKTQYSMYPKSQSTTSAFNGVGDVRLQSRTSNVTAPNAYAQNSPKYDFSASAVEGKSIGVSSGIKSETNGAKYTSVSGSSSQTTYSNKIASSSSSSASSFSATTVSSPFQSSTAVSTGGAMTRGVVTDNYAEGAGNDPVSTQDGPVGSALWLLLLLMPYAIYKFRQ